MSNAVPSNVDLQQLVAEADTGGRKPGGSAGRLIYAVAIAWSLFQIWYASPLPYILGFGIFGDTEARAFHLSFALFLAFAAYPAFVSSPRNRVPLVDWLLAAAGICAVLYLVVFYRDIAMRPGLPTQGDILAAVVGVVLLLEASRRAEGPWMPIIAIVALLYVFLGPYLPGLMAHRGSSLSRAASHFWLTSEGVFGVALGVSTNFIFLFVLFGALLEKAGAGNYFIQLSFALLGKFRGGPAKAAVVSSGLTGMISGSSVANVVTTGTFTIPADEARRLSRRESRRDRVRRRRQRPADAAGDGRSRVPDGRVCRHHLCRGLQARLPAGGPDLRRAVLCGRSGGGEGRHDRHRAAARPAP